jgi:methionyl aminopeptidase
MIQLKNDYEIDKIRSSCKLLAEMFETVGENIKEGISTWDVDKMCEDFMRKHHAKGPCKGYEGFPAVSCTSVNDAIIHGIPSKRQILSEGDLLSLDVCISLDGYISDSTHSYEIGKVRPEVHEFNVNTRKSLYLGIQAAGKNGARIQDIGQAVSSYARKFKYGILKDYTGHGVGLELHEDPEVPNYVSIHMNNPRIREGMVFAIEPMLMLGGSSRYYLAEDDWGVMTADGSYGCHWEHTVAMTKNGLEILTEL